MSSTTTLHHLAVPWTTFVFPSFCRCIQRGSYRESHHQPPGGTLRPHFRCTLSHCPNHQGLGLCWSDTLAGRVWKLGSW
ncbi:hypothetical protein M011DRAFT_290086 [Sporormia fimetaria CBS 119925]|uniref:Uncharacterized protein n=1 Tax=Sporormia fimetaria CBS 119925 TaxID=1340428 RepID=A0A6A6UX08_9PLEO|nr:hypothetical protein M011DRAFT_290086 [Sporormia fimetaria CBS 119925]